MRARNKEIDNVKAYATLMVILAHSLNDNFLVGNYASLSIGTKLFNTFFNIIASTAVPLFLISTGYFLYDRERDFKEILERNILPLWLSYSLWVILNRPLNSYSILDDLPAIVKEIFLLKSAWPRYLWYIPALFGIYIMSPLIQKFLLSLGKKDFKYLFKIVLFITIFDYYVLISKMFGGTNLTLNIGIDINPFILLLFSIYGYYFKNYLEKQNSNSNYLILLLVFILLFIPQYKLLTNQVGQRVYNYPLGILLSLLTFNVIYSLKFPMVFERGFKFISENSLLYYFMHRFVLYNLNENFFFINKVINSIISFFLGVAIVTIFIIMYKTIKKIIKNMTRSLLS